jgi:DNA-binding SARP family transcriptional activator
MEFEVLGPVRVRGHGDARELLGKMRRTLLSVLLAHANQPVSVDTLVGAIWGVGDDAPSGHALQLHVHKVRRMLDRPERLKLVAEGYRLQVLPGELDSERFESLIDEAETVAVQDAERGVRLLRKALALWNGEPYGGADIAALVSEAERLTERRLAALELLYETELRCGRYVPMIGELTALVRRNPLRERLHGSLMIALYRAGRQADALGAYRAARATLVEELGIEPGPELRRIEQRILAGDTIVPATAGQLPQATVPAQLPHDVRGFVGRDSELSELDEVLAGTCSEPIRIAMIAGTAGVGKTALAVRWAHRVHGRFPDGQLYVDLRGYGPDEPVSASDGLAAFLRALGVEGPDIPPDLADRAALYRTLVARRRMLIVLDNARTPDQVRPLLPGGRTCFVLVNSRDALIGLGVREGAHRVLLDRLRASDALDLFHSMGGERARAEPRAAATLVERCARLPLALRVAAEQIKSRGGVSAADLADELADQQRRLDALDVDGDPNTAVRAVFSWSYRHLRPAAARLFRLWGLHPGHVVDPHALAVLAEDDPTITRRTVATLVQAHLAEEVAPGRYEMHDLMRAYATELAMEEEPVEQRDAAVRRLLTWYLHTVVAARFAVDPYARRIELEAAPPHVPTFEDRAAGLRWFGLERQNLVAAVRLAGERGEHTLCWRITSALLTFFHLGKHWDDWFTTHHLGLAAARAHEDLLGQAYMLNGLGVAYGDVGQGADAIEAHREAAELYTRTANRTGAAWNLNNLGVVYDDLRRFPEAVACYEEALALFQELGDPRGQGLALCNLGDVHRQLHEPDRAVETLRQAMAIQQAAGDLHGQRFTLTNLGDLHREAGDSEAATESYRAALVISKDLGDRWRVARLLDRLAETLSAAGEIMTSIAYAREARAMFTDLRARPAAHEHPRSAAPDAAISASP